MVKSKEFPYFLLLVVWGRLLILLFIFKKGIDFCRVICYNLNVIKVENNTNTKQKKNKNFSKIFEKTIDKLNKVWYNVYVIKRDYKKYFYKVGSKNYENS